MNKDKYLKLLENNLKYMSEEEKKDIIAEYHMHFVSSKKEQKSEQEIIDQLGTPIEIAKELNAIYAINQVEEDKNARSILRAVLSIMGLSVMNLCIMFISFFVLLILLPFLLAYIIGVPIMILSPIILIFMGIINGFHTIGMEDVYEVIKGVIFGSLLAVVGYYVGKNFFKLLIKNLRWNISIAKGRV
ncbi:HAAS signaling domain-containing protein [Priestia aryabhattai]|uniref:HAAS signaling domain-containing protein n=1 Tax=Priestia aryabhattai TaxID=412384 RepID=UPI00064E9EEF|nr:DUF1700 domain-containing protein [Priestia aryabhattai]KML31379.1 hypothetical protein VL11_02145 [Priestia aryabhattai]KMN91410.1 hypothetical protein ABV89_27845 [Priestia aryabhattai]